jgi:hypothetical protein
MADLTSTIPGYVQQLAVQENDWWISIIDYALKAATFRQRRPYQVQEELFWSRLPTKNLRASLRLERTCKKIAPQ